MTEALRAEARKLTTTQVLLWMVVLVVGLSVLIAALTAGLSDVGDTGGMEDLLNGTFGIAILVSSVLGVIGITGEYRHQTVTPTFLGIPNRSSIITAKMITYAVTGLVLGVLAALTVCVVAGPWLAARGIENLGADNVPRIIVGGILAAGIWGVIGVGVGAMLRNQIAAVVTILLYRLLLEGILFSTPKVNEAYPYLPGGATSSLLSTSNDADLDFSLLSPWVGGLLLLAYGLLFAFIASRLTVRRDVS